MKQISRKGFNEDNVWNFFTEAWATAGTGNAGSSGFRARRMYSDVAEAAMAQ
jgi:hypothetical protein